MATAKQPKVKPVIRKFFIDDEGNNFVLIKSTDKRIAISLKLKEDFKTRRIGVITKSTRTIEIKRDRSIHLFLKGNAYGFNDYIMREAKNFDTIRLKDEISDWKIPRQFILDNGKYLNFSQKGFELQRFLSLEQLEQFKVLPKENRRF